MRSPSYDYEPRRPTDVFRVPRHLGLFLSQAGSTRPVTYEDYIDAQIEAGFQGETPMAFGSSKGVSGKIAFTREQLRSLLVQ